MTPEEIAMRRFLRLYRLQLAFVAVCAGMVAGVWFFRTETAVVSAIVGLGFAALCYIVALAVWGFVSDVRGVVREFHAWRAGGREPQRLADAVADLPRVSAEAERVAAAERTAAQSRFCAKRTADLVRTGVPRAVAEQDAETLWAAIDLGTLG